MVDLVDRLVAATESGERVARVTLDPVLLSEEGAVPTDVEVVLVRRDVDPLVEVRHL